MSHYAASTHTSTPQKVNFRVVNITTFEKAEMALMKKFYTELLLPAFPDPDELPKDINTFLKWCSGPRKGHRAHCVVTLLIKEHSDEIIGGIFGEYYPRSNAGVVIYYVVSPKYRGAGLGKAVMEAFVAFMSDVTKSFTKGNFTKPRAIFLETNNLNAPGEKPDLIRKRWSILQSLGFYRIDFPYVQQPLDKHTKPVEYLYLTVYREPITTPSTDSKSGKKGRKKQIKEKKKRENTKAALVDWTAPSLTSDFVYNFVHDYWTQTCDFDPEGHPLFLKMKSAIKAYPELPVVPLAVGPVGRAA